jgi:hypothetical protein
MRMALLQQEWYVHCIPGMDHLCAYHPNFSKLIFSTDHFQRDKFATRVTAA